MSQLAIEKCIACLEPAATDDHGFCKVCAVLDDPEGITLALLTDDGAEDCSD